MKPLHKLILLLVLAAGAMACNKDLDLEPTDTIDETRAFRSVADLEKGLIGVYSAFGAGQANGIYIAAILSDEVKLSNENRGQGQFTFKWQYASGLGEHNADYATYYTTIDRANRVLAVMDDIEPANDNEAVQKNRIRAELLAFRGMSHYELLKRFMPSGYDAGAMGVPVMLVSNLEAKPARNSVGEVVAQIEEDLGAARDAAELPANSEDGLELSKAAVAAYQARVALLKRDWSAAITYATDAIGLAGVSLTGIGEYPDIWTDDTNGEVVLRFRNDYGIQTFWTDTNGDVFFEPSDKLKSQYDQDNDIRYPSFFGSAGDDTSIVVKYPGSALQGPQNNDIKAVRLSELYLIRAEAYAENGQLSEAAADLNAVSSNRIDGYADVSFSSKEQAISAILNERFKELAYEGFRFFDLKRRGLGVERFASDVQSTAWQNLAANDFKFALPIPQDEIFANPNTEQNPGY